MHKKKLPKIFYFIDKILASEIKGINKEIAIILRNYNKNYNIDEVNEIKNIIKKNKNKFYLANDIKMALKLNLDGVYLPAFNKNIKLNIYSKRKNFNVIGSAHNLKEIKIKETQGCELIFLAPVFKVNKKSRYLGILEFNKISNLTKTKIVALGGINDVNLKKLNLLKIYGFASISWIKKNRPKINLGRFKF